MGIKMDQEIEINNQKGLFIQDRSVFDDYYVFTKTMVKQGQMLENEMK